MSKQFDINQNIIESHVPEYDCLLDGGLGLCYYYSFLYKITGLKKYKKIAVGLIEEIFDRFNKNEIKVFGNSYASGITGFAYATSVINEILDLQIDLKEEFSSLDDYLFENLVLDVKNDKLDCLYNAFGTTHYFISSLSKNSNQAVKIICDKARISSEGLWFENIFESEDKDRNVANLSTAHGLTGMLLILFNSLKYTEHKYLVEETIKNGIKFIINNSVMHKLPDARGMFYSKVNINKDSLEMYPRLAWCYGDLGVALLLYKCSNYFGNSDYKAIADKAGLDTINKRSQKTSFVEDPFFCHGSSGVAMMYKQLFSYSELPQYNEAKEFWLNCTLNYFKNKSVNHNIYQKKHSMIEGLLGVNLSIAANLNNSDDDWLNMFFL